MEDQRQLLAGVLLEDKIASLCHEGHTPACTIYDNLTSIIEI